MLVHSTEWDTMIHNLQLKPLCSLILERTINDPDKYQSGLTKIFFRAGMLAALESLRSGRLNALVTIVQKNMRRRMAVKKYQELRRATIKIQTWWRGIMAKRFVEGVRRTVAATRLQTAVRRFNQRKRFIDVRTSVVKLQSRKCLFDIIVLSGWRGVEGNFGCQVCVVLRQDAFSRIRDGRMLLLFCRVSFVECTCSKFLCGFMC